MGGNIRKFLINAIAMKASDIHLKVDRPSYIRVPAGLTMVADMLVTQEDVEDLAREFKFYKKLEKMMNSEDQFSFDAAMQMETREGTQRLRVHAFKTLKGVCMNFRPIPINIPTVENLKLPKEMINVVNRTSGVAIICGATGSGKTTTLASLIDHVNKTSRRAILTVEEPIEFCHTPVGSVIEQREVGEHVESFASGIRDAMREDPEIILIGEMRDLETITAGITAGETGHLLLATLHTKSVFDAIDRLIDVFPPEQQEQIRIQLASVLTVIVHQTIIRHEGRIYMIPEILTLDTVFRNAIRSREKLNTLKDRMRNSSGCVHVVDSFYKANREGLPLEAIKPHMSEEDFKMLEKKVHGTN